MNIDKRKQKILSVIIGLLISILLLAIGFGFIQRRGGRAAATPTNFSCEGSANSITVNYENGSSNVGRVAYGVEKTQLTFIADEVEEPDEIGNGTFQHQIELTLIPAATVEYIEIIGDDGTRYNDNGEPWQCQTKGTADETEAEEATPEAELEPSVSPSITPTPTPTEVVELEEFVAWFEDHPGATPYDCITADDFEGQRGLVQKCNQAYNQVVPPEPTARPSATPTPTP